MPGKATVGDQDRPGRQRPVHLVHQPRHVDRPLVGAQPDLRLGAPALHPRRDLGDVVGARRLRPRTVVLERVGEILQAEPGIADQRDLGTGRPPDLLRDDVQVDQGHVRRHQGKALGGDLPQLAADDDQAVRAFDQLVGDARKAAEQPGGERMGAGQPALAGDRVGHGNGLRLGKVPNGVIRPGQVNAAADQQDRALRVPDERRSPVHIGAVGAGSPRRTGERAGIDPERIGVEIMGVVADVLRHVQDHRSGPAGRGHGKGMADKLRDPLNPLDPDQLLDGRPEDLGLARLLGHVLPGMVAVGVAHKDDLRHAGVEGLHQAGDQVGGAGPKRRVAHARPVRHPCKGIGGKGAAALVIDQMVCQALLPDGLVERQQLEPAHAEHRPHPGQRQHLGHGLTAPKRAVGVGRRLVLRWRHRSGFLQRAWAASATKSRAVMPGRPPSRCAASLIWDSTPVA